VDGCCRLSDALTQSAYGYVGNDPTNGSDPTGLYFAEGFLGGLLDPVNPLILIERAQGGWVDRYRAYEVVVNGESRAELRRGEKQAIKVDSEEIEIFLRIDWCRSRTVRLSLAEGTEARLFCRPRRLLTAFYGITFARDDYVRLESA
jgi:hypothetical protein